MYYFRVFYYNGDEGVVEASDLEKAERIAKRIGPIQFIEEVSPDYNFFGKEAQKGFGFKEINGKRRKVEILLATP
jgi:hypothetical protein